MFCIKKNSLLGLCCFFCVQLPLPSYAYDFYYPDAYPYMVHSDHNQGFAVELVKKAAREVHLPVEVKFLPWKRAQHEVLSGNNKLILMNRTAAREEHYQWVAHIAEVESVIASVGYKVNSVAEAQEKLTRLNLILGAGGIPELKRSGFPEEKLVRIPAGESLVTFMIKRPNVGWMAQRLEVLSLWNTYGKGVHLKIGDTLKKRSLWLACSKECADIPVQKLANILSNLKKSSWYKKRREEYINRLVPRK